MKHDIRLKNLSAGARVGLEALVASLTGEHLNRWMPTAESEAACLFVTLEKLPPERRFRATLRLELPGRALISRAEEGDIESAAEVAFAELEARLRRHMAQLRRRDREPQRSSGTRLRRLEASLPDRPATGQTNYFDQVKDLLAGLTSFVQRELIYLRSSGELASDYPTVDDVVDEVLVRALDRSQSGELEEVSETELLKLSIAVLAEQVAGARTELLEGLAFDDSDEIDPAQALYYQDQIAETQTERGGFESLLPSSAPSDPAEAANFEQVRRLLLESLRLLPMSWRRIVMLSQMDDQSVEAVAATLELDEHTVQSCLEHADAFLRDRLRQAAVEVPDRATPAAYLVIERPFSAAAEEIEQELSMLLEAAKKSESA